MASPDLVSLLRAARAGDRSAADQLFAALYADLKRLAHAQLARSRGAEETLQTTALVHEAYVRLVEPKGLAAEDRAHFFNLAARVMRHVVIDWARRRASAKRGRALRVTWPEGFDPAAEERQAAPTALALDAALASLERESPRLAQLVQLRFFGGLPIAEIASLLDVSDRTLKRDWRRARAFLLAELG
ncbi:MAG TPA: ECF-type sigma factor [Thermoanaerobaculia bacterium]|nr:ECF-type sigma factor [Thermoanaerobaculia bacterium]